MHAKSLQLCLILCDPMDCSPPDFSVHGILQARLLQWVMYTYTYTLGFLNGSVSKESTCNAGDTEDRHLIPGLGRSSGGGNGIPTYKRVPLQYSRLKNSMDRGAQ